MNKLLTKIVGVSLGLALAAGVGVGVAVSNRGFEKVEAAGTSVSIQKSDLGSIYNTNKTVTKTVSSANDLSVAFSGVNTKSSATATTDYAYMMFVKNSGFAYSSTCPSGYYPSKVSFTFTSGTGTGGFVGIGFATNTSGVNSRDSSVSGAVTKSGTFELENNDKTKLYWNFSTTGANVQIQTISLVYSSTSAADPTVTSVVVTAGSQVGTYKNDTHIQCTAVVNGANDPSQTVVWTLSSTTSYVANQTEVSGASIDNTGKVSFSNDASVYAFATSTVSGYTSVRGSALCSVSGLLDPVTYVKVDKTSRLSAGTKVVILNNADTYAMSVTQNTNNRAAEAVEVDDSGDNPVVDVIPTKVQIFTLIAGVESGFNFSFDDNGTTKYLYANGTGNNYYLKTGASRYADSTDFNISVIDGAASISLVQTTYNGVMQYNSSKLFSCYASANQNGLSIYMEGSALPSESALTSISNVTASNVEVGSSTTVTASYLPTNATEDIDVTISGSGNVTCSAVSMSSGTATFTITGETAGSITITLTGHVSTTVTANTSITVTAFTATHTKATSASNLYNGAKVIFGNFDSNKVGATHTGGNNMPTAAGSFNSDGSALSNAGNTGCEYTMWYLTIADSEENNVSGWAFYDNGHYLTTATGTNNYWKQTQELSSLCLFNITFEAGTASIVAADSHVQRGTIALNGSIISAYASLGTYGAIDMYVKESSSDSAIAAGYEDFYLMMDCDLTSHGYCTSKGWYDYAKNVYNNTLTNSQKNELSANGVARLQAWAVANGDVLTTNPGTITQASRINVIGVVSENTTALTIIVITAVLGFTTIGGYFLLRKKKEER